MLNHTDESRSCPAILITAPGSHHGKTTVTAGMARFYARQGLNVRVFKVGPDFLDPMMHAQASGQPVYQLDLWLAGEDECRCLLYEAAQTADLILIEGVMGLFDGKPSSADLAEKFGIPVLAVIDAKGVAQTLGAIGLGLASYRKTLKFAGLLANAIASPRHAEMVEEGIPAGLKYFGGLPRSSQFALPERHLGLMQAQEVVDIELKLNAAADAIALTGVSELPEPVAFLKPQVEVLTHLLQGVKIGIARDAAFSFIYQANLDLLEQLGAELIFFSPLADQTLPEVHSVYLPGGYPELYLDILQANNAMRDALIRHHAAQKPIYAECGGMLYLLESLTDQHGKKAIMTGLLAGHAVMQNRLQGLGYQTANTPSGAIRSHTFHHSMVNTALQTDLYGERLYNTSAGEPIFQVERLVASYLHCYFPSNPTAVSALFKP
jgi:cobyrinic acid a,c-diamide synthase